MKKRVRIYKATNGEGQFINKTAQFLKKAQEGGMPDPNEMGYPGSQQQTAQVTDDQLASFVLNEIGTSAPRESIVVKLVNAYGKEPMEAVQFVDKMYKYVEQKQQEEIDSAQEEDADTEEITSGDDVANEMPVEEEVRQTPTGTQMSNEIVDEWDSEGDDDDSEAAANLIMQYGGYYRAQDGAEVPIEMPDLSTYLPQNISDYYGNSDYISQMAYPELEEDTEEYQGFEAPDMPEDVDFDVARYGGSKKSKKQFVKSVLSLVKKQMGGPNEDSETSSNDADPTGSSVRKQNLDKFINSVKNESAMATAQKQAEEHYDQMMQQQQMYQQYPVVQNGGEQNIYQGQDFENPMHHLAAYSQAAGDVFSQDQNQMIHARNGGGIFGRQRMPRDFNFGYGLPPITKIDVRKSGWLTGRPRQYSIEFGQGSPMPGMGSQNQGTGMYTLDGKIYRWPATRKKVEVDAASVNKDAIKEVATATPDSNATTKAAETDVTSTTSSSTEGTVAKDVKAGDTKETVTTIKNGKTIVKAVDAKPVPGVTINSPIGNGNSSSELNKIIDAQSKIKKEVQRDSWGRPKTDKYYGYNPKTGKYEQGKVEKNWKTKSGNEAKSFEGTYTTDWGNVKPARYQIVKDKNGKIIPEKSFAAVTQSEDYGGVIYVPWNELPNRNSDEGEDWNSGAGGDMLENKYGGSINYEIGGSVNDPFMDPYGNLQQFIDGGDEDFTQADIDDVYSKDTANGDFPMAQFGRSIGRAIRNYFPANVMPVGQYTKMQRGPYNPQTGQAQNFIPGAGTYLKNIDVKKSSWLTGAPKKYTVTYGSNNMALKNDVASQSGRDRYCSDFPNSPRCQGNKQNADVNANSMQRSNVDDLSLNAKMAIRKGERQNERNSRRLERQGLDEYGNLIGSEQSDKVPMSNVEMFTKQGKIWDEKSKRWIVKPEPLSAPMQYMKDSLTLPNNPQPFSSDQLINTSGPRNTEMQYGGDLRRFMPYVQIGAETPVTYANNPALSGMTNADMFSFNLNKKRPTGSDFGMASTELKLPGVMDKDYSNPLTGAKPGVIKDKSGDLQINEENPSFTNPSDDGEFSVDYKTKNLFGKLDYLNVANAGIRDITGMINRAQDRKSEAKMYENYNADNLYAAKTVMDQGDYDPNTGLYRPPSQGALHTSRSAKYGGDVYQDGGYVEGDEVYMTDDEIQEFLANGGDLEFI